VKGARIRMKKLVLITILLVFGLACPALAESVGVGLKVKVGPQPAVAAFSELYIAPNFSLALSLGVQTPSITIDAIGKFYLPENTATLAFYSGAGGRLGILKGSVQPFISLLIGMKLNLGLNLNLLGELVVFSSLPDPRRYTLEPYLGVEARFKF